MRVFSLHPLCSSAADYICVIRDGFTVAIRTVLPSIFTSLTRIANASDPLKLALSEISYKPFISLFNVTQATIADPGIAGIGTPPLSFQSFR